MIRLATPEWALILPLLALAIWRWPVLRRPLRLALLGLIVLLLLQPELRRHGRGLDLWVLVDRSASASQSVEPHRAEWEQLLQRSRRPDDRLHLVDYADEAVERDATAGVSLPGSRERTRTALAIRHALSRLEEGRSARLLVLSDGFSTEPLTGLAELLARAEVPLDFRLAPDTAAGDYRLLSLSLPAQAQPGEPVLLEFRVGGPPGGGKVPFVILRNGAELTRGVAEIPANRLSTSLRFTDRLATPGGHRYEVRLLPENDPHPGNNHAGRWMEITGGPRLLLLTAYTDDPLAPALRAQGFSVEVIERDSPSPGRLQGARAVILNNVPATLLSRPFMEALDFFVRGQGGGLMMVGGAASFGRGGYFSSPIADLLPVSMEQRQEERKLAVALGIALDRSGSMGASAGAGETKMTLANSGAARAVSLLGPMDQVAVYAVDTAPHTIVPLSVIGEAKAKLEGKVMQITAGGGGIYVGEALEKLHTALAKSPRGVRHAILFADAADAEEPGDYKKRIAAMLADGITLSVIGLGNENNSDAPLLKTLAELGKGRIFFADDAGQIPALFEQETVRIARSAFLDEPVALEPQAAWAELAARPLEWLPKVDAWNLNYLRPGASAAALAAREEGEDPAPLVAFWQRESGRVAAVSFPLGGPHSESARAWPEYADFVQTLARWLMGEAIAPGVAVRAAVDGTELGVTLLYEPEWEETLALHPPRALLSGTGGESIPLQWERMEPGRFRASASLNPGQSVRGAVQVGQSIIPFGPLEAAAGVEWDFDLARPAELAALSRTGGGAERLDLTTVWEAPRPSAYLPLRGPLLGATLGLFLLEALLFRLGRGVRLPKLPRPSVRKKAAPAQKPVATAPEPPPPPAPPTASDRSERFRRAKRGQ